MEKAEKWGLWLLISLDIVAVLMGSTLVVMDLILSASTPRTQYFPFSLPYAVAVLDLFITLAILSYGLVDGTYRVYKIIDDLEESEVRKWFPQHLQSAAGRLLTIMVVGALYAWVNPSWLHMISWFGSFCTSALAMMYSLCLFKRWNQEDEFKIYYYGSVDNNNASANNNNNNSNNNNNNNDINNGRHLPNHSTNSHSNNNLTIIPTARSSTRVDNANGRQTHEISVEISPTAHMNINRKNDHQVPPPPPFVSRPSSERRSSASANNNYSNNDYLERPIVMMTSSSSDDASTLIAASPPPNFKNAKVGMRTFGGGSSPENQHRRQSIKNQHRQSTKNSAKHLFVVPYTTAAAVPSMPPRNAVLPMMKFGDNNTIASITTATATSGEEEEEEEVDNNSNHPYYSDLAL